MREWPLRRHATLPQALRRSGRSDWGARHGRPELHSFLEGPVLEPSGSLLVVDVAWGRVLRVDESGRFEVVMEGLAAPNGLALGDDGATLHIADAIAGLVRAERSGDGFEVVHRLEAWQGAPFLGLNDLVLGSDGGVFVTDQGMTGLHDPTGRVLHVGGDGTETVLLDGVPSPNGLAVRHSGDELLLAVTRDNAIWRVPFDAALRPYRVGRYIQLSGGVGPDGIALADDGSLFVAHLGLGAVWMFDPAGRPVGRFEAAEGAATTNVTYSASEALIYVTEAETASVLVGDVPA